MWPNKVTPRWALSLRGPRPLSQLAFPAIGQCGRHGEGRKVPSVLPSPPPAESPGCLSSWSLTPGPSLDTVFLEESGDVGREGRELLNCPRCPRGPQSPFLKRGYTCRGAWPDVFLPSELGSNVQQQQEGVKLDKREDFPVHDSLRGEQAKVLLECADTLKRRPAETVPREWASAAARETVV